MLPGADHSITEHPHSTRTPHTRTQPTAVDRVSRVVAYRVALGFNMGPAAQW